MFRRLILISVSFVALSISQPIGTTTDNPTCSTNFFLMERSLLENTNNRFNLLKAFYPPREARPVVLKVNFTFTDTQKSKIWYWSESEFYFIQPLEIFQFTSLFFANGAYRQSDLVIELDTNCSDAADEFFKILTTRVSLEIDLFVFQYLSCI